MATKTLSRIPLPAQVMTLARFLARKSVKEHLQACGIKLHMIEASEISKATDAYLQVRKAEFIAEAKLILHR
jgi:hypothetical protein